MGDSDKMHSIDVNALIQDLQEENLLSEWLPQTSSAHTNAPPPLPIPDLLQILAPWILPELEPAGLHVPEDENVPISQPENMPLRSVSPPKIVHKKAALFSEGQNRERIVGGVYAYSEGEVWSLDRMDLNNESYSNPYHVHKQVKRTVKAEFCFEDNFLKQKRRSAKRPRKRRNPSKDENVWIPESIYRAYTNIKPPYCDWTEYQINLPRTSCFGKINMRNKGAWTRSSRSIRKLQP